MSANAAALQVAEVALTREVAAVHALSTSAVHPIEESRRIRSMAADLEAQALYFHGLADRICQSLA